MRKHKQGNKQTSVARILLVVFFGIFSKSINENLGVLISE